MHLDIIVGGRYMEIKSKADMMESSYHKYSGPMSRFSTN